MKQINILLFFLFFTIITHGQQTIGLMYHSSGSNDDGYVLFSPNNYHASYLIDKCGKLIHSWNHSYRPGLSAYLLPGGDLLRPSALYNNIFHGGGTGGLVELIDWDGNVIWSYQISNNLECQHHDVKALPNGNILAISYELKTKAEAIAAGRNPSQLGNALWSEKVVELLPLGSDSAQIVWEWHLWDHLVQKYDSLKPNFGVIADHPERVNLNYFKYLPTSPDWIHMNSIDYNPVLDQILVCSPHFDEIWVIDHSTTTAEAASHTGGNSNKGGDILYRWGNQATYNMGTVNDKKLFGPHDAKWIPNDCPHGGKIMIFNNGLNRPGGNYSSVEIIDQPVDTNGVYAPVYPCLPATPYWTYSDTIPANFYAFNISGAQMLANGNVLICNGPLGTFFEIDSLKNTVWKYINPVNNYGPQGQGTNPVNNLVFRTQFYRTDYPGFINQSLIPGLPIELNPLPYVCDLTTGIQNIIDESGITIYPNPASGNLTVQSTEPIKNIRILQLTNSTVMEVNETGNIDISSLKPGCYFIVTTSDSGIRHNAKLIVQRN